MNILIAEDQPTAALVLRRMLEKLGHRVVVAPDGETAWRIICEGKTPVLITDWMMPRLDGLDLCRRVRAAGGDRYTYIILLTARDRRDDRLKGLRAGADDFLTKPTCPDELILRLEIAERHPGRPRSSCLAKPPTGPPGGSRWIDRLAQSLTPSA